MKNLLLTILAAATLSAGTIQITYDNGLAGNSKRTATVNATFNTNSLTLVINGVVNNINDVGQAVSGVDFSIVGGLTGTLASTSGQLINVANDGTFSNASGNPDWFQAAANDFETTALGSSNPDNVLIGAPNGSNVYSNANGSIKSNKAHNPFTKEQITLVYSIAGLTSTSNFSSFRIAFGTGPTWFDIPSDRIPPNEVPNVPEPATYAMMGGALIGLAFLRKKM
jgi:hypothetical protein